LKRANVLAFVLAGGEGVRLRPLTKDDAKPALHFAQGHRIIDFVLGNLCNSAVSSIHVLAQYKPDSLVEHVKTVWAGPCLAPRSGIDVIVSDNYGPVGSFKGTAHAVQRCLNVMTGCDPDVVAVFAADHVYRMDVQQMVDFHLVRDSDVTVAGIPVPVDEAASFGVMSTDAAGRVRQFREKPLRPDPIPADPARACASMGNYLFKPQVLEDLLYEAVRRGETDFGAHLMPRLPASGVNVLAYDFASNELPGIKPYEDRTYWRDVGTLDSLEQARADVEGEFPRFDLRNPEWPIRRDLLTARPLGSGRSNAPLRHAGQYHRGIEGRPWTGLDYS